MAFASSKSGRGGIPEKSKDELSRFRKALKRLKPMKQRYEMNAAIVGSKIPVAVIKSGSSSWRYPSRGKRYENPISGIISDQRARILSRRFDAFEISISWGLWERGLL
jgi:hypothetical protein